MPLSKVCPGACKHLGHDHSTCFFNTQDEQVQNDQNTRNNEPANKQEEGNEDLRLILNAKRKGKKVAFENEPDPMNNGTTEVTTGKINATPPMLNEENISVHELAINNCVFAKAVVGDGIADAMVHDHVEHVMMGKFVVDKDVADVENEVAAVCGNVGQVHVGNIPVGDSFLGVDIGDVVVHDNAVHANNLPMTYEHITEDDLNYDDPIIAALLDKN
ncbi:hypothetical protein Salat_0221600 [Sesamum alatum]|uniref:Uncharacterized protein n=1 Tax=Sesamum alatum TaxID=300844 RepID=A0AAE1YY41_9LAMI|nr:hypothetical protein Salat_0221600 [Sesamum alatum]